MYVVEIYTKKKKKQKTKTKKKINNIENIRPFYVSLNNQK